MLHHHYILWGNSYTEPGNGHYKPPTWALEGYLSEDNQPSAALVEAKGEMGNGWAVCCTSTETQRTLRRSAPVQKARERRRRLWKRCKKKAPLFALTFYNDALAARYGYYLRGEDPVYIPLHAPSGPPPRGGGVSPGSDPSTETCTAL